MNKPRKTTRFKLASALVALAGLMTVRVAVAAPCCASNAAAPSLLSGDDQAQLSATVAYGSVIGDAPERGIAVFRSEDESERTLTYRLDGAMLVSDRWQLGASVQVSQRSLSRQGFNGTSTGLGDARLTAGFEALPEWTYSEWRPKGYAFAQLTLPTGKSLYETASDGGVSATGRGFYSIAAGALFVKRWSLIDGYVLPEGHYSFERSFDDRVSGETISVTPGFGTSVALGIGVSPGEGALRAGLRLQPSYNQYRRIRSGSGESVSSYQLVWDTALEATYLVNDLWSVNAAIIDQTLFGPAVNSTLSRTFALGVRHGWQR